MRSFLLATLATASMAMDRQLADYINYLMVHRKAYETVDEFDSRFGLFREADHIIREHNMGGHSFTLGHNFFSDMTAEEKRTRTHGRIQDNREERVVTSVHEPSTDYPASVDWRDHGAVTPVKDQGQCGSCWTFSSTGAMEGMYAVTTGTLLSFAEQQLVDCVYDRNGCNGGLQIDAFDYYKTKGVILEEDYTYTASSQRNKALC